MRVSKKGNKRVVAQSHLARHIPSQFNPQTYQCAVAKTTCMCVCVFWTRLLLCCLCRKPVDVGSLLRFKSHVVDVQYQLSQQSPAAAVPGEQLPPEQDQQQHEQQREALVVVEVAAVVSQPERKGTTHTNTFRWG